jgi:hypothetical protein
MTTTIPKPDRTDRRLSSVEDLPAAAAAVQQQLARVTELVALPDRPRVRQAGAPARRRA